MNFENWNDSTIEYYFIEVITRGNHPHDDNYLSDVEYESKLNTLQNYINWKKKQKLSNFLSFTKNTTVFTPEKMQKFLDIIRSNKYFEEQLLRLWHKNFEIVHK